MGPSVAQAADGAALYSQNCTACHQVNGTGVPGAFPPLAGNPALKDEAHVRTVIEKGLTGPLDVGGQRFDGTMPAFGGTLSGAEIQALTDYIRSSWGNDFGTAGADASTGAPASGAAGTGQASGTPPATPSASEVAPSAPTGTAAPATAAPAPAAAVAAGRALFSGRVRLQNGGPPCAACHSVDGANPLGGGTMGLDLTTAYDRLGQSAGLKGVLTTIAFPVMRQAFATHPLTQPEIDDLIAYLQQTAATAQAQGTASRDPARFGFNWLWLFGATGAALLFTLLLAWWPRQRESVAEHLRRTGRLGRNRR
ncbi:MAG: c-type cytochrome [Deinococcales bacterium]|jgi:ubiquinol-cytochrome c reductase cytochrome c subunit